MRTQVIESQKGEIEFRKKLYQQQVEGQRIFEDEFDATGVEKILQDRMQKTLDQMSALRRKGIPLSPYVEIGAERCQRSLVMENDLGANGAALDISFDMLRSSDYYREVFGRIKSPVRICCDANHLPLMSSSVPFVFCYETLHHFPEPGPIVEEIYRVLLPGGRLFFDEEPYRQVLHINLYRGAKIYSEQSLHRSKIRKVLDRFFCERRCNETEHGIVENDRISLASWKQALQCFDEKDIELNAASRYPILRSSLFNPRSYLSYFASYLLGGNISGVARKRGDGAGRNCRSIYEALACPSCRETDRDVPLKQDGPGLLCPECRKTYPVRDGVLFLFAYDRFQELYPQVFDSLQKE